MAHTKACRQLGLFRDSRPSLGKVVTQDSDQALSIRLSRSSSPSLGPVEFCQTSGEDQFPEKTGLSEDLSFRPEADVPEAVETNPMAQSLNFGDDLYQVDIPNSVGEDTKDMSREGDSIEPSRELFSRMSQAEAIQYAKNFSEELGALRAKILEKEKRIRQLILEKDELSKKINNLEGRVDALEGDK